MAREVVDKEIDGHSYKFGQLGALKSHRVLFKITKVVGPAFGALGDSMKGVDSLESILDADVDFQSVIEKFFDNAEESIVEEIIETMLKQVAHFGEDGKEGVGQLDTSAKIDLCFSGRLPSMYKVVFAALAVEYGGFLGEGGMLEGISRKVAALSLKQQA